MKNSSLERASNIIAEALSKTEQLDKIDKTELMMNINLFLKENEYRENVKILAKRRNNKWKNK